ncbi:FUSC family protein [Streptomyces sp. L-9-10]|uniref:FUSC family protein n=1 Tax=Streptomyces sp. L-9-10 TaxID=1478131 RepID=UPI00101CBD31|nr:FUSC family protein [Streptomyces sp. L-9-10]
MADRDPERTRGGLRATRSYLGGFRWRELLRFGPFRWGDVALWRAARVATGVIVPLAVGSATGHLDYGAFASLGALPAGFASFQGVTRTRVAAVAAASVGMAVSTFVGATTVAAAPWLLVLVVMIWGYLVGLAVCLGPRWSVAVVQGAVALLIAVGIPLGPTSAALRAGLVLAGGLFQAALVIASWALRRGDPERAALAASYRGLAGYASEVAAGRGGVPPPLAFPAAARLTDPNPLLPDAVRLAFDDLLEEAESVRAGLAALATQSIDAPSRRAVSRFAADANAALEAIADTLTTKRAERADRVFELRRLMAALPVPPAAADWRWAADDVLGHLRAATGILARLDPVPGRKVKGELPRGQRTPIPPETGKWAALTLRANLTPTGETGRHAVRLAVTVGLAEVIVQASGLYEGRWIVLTIFLVLKPDYNATVYQSIQRAIGTAAGAGLGAAVAAMAHVVPSGLIIAAAITVAVAYALFDVNYLLYSIFLTLFIVILLEILGLPAGTTAAARLTSTAIGTALALVAYSLWPTWEGTAAHKKFARLMEAQGTYGTALLREYAHPGQIPSARLRALQTSARRALSDAEASAARLADEPPQPPLTPAMARKLVATMTRLANTELSLHALLTTSAPVASREKSRSGDARTEPVDNLGTAFGTTMRSLAEALRSQQPPGKLPPLHRLQTALRDQAPAIDARLVPVTDSLADALDTLETILRRNPAG